MFNGKISRTRGTFVNNYRNECQPTSWGPLRRTSAHAHFHGQVLPTAAVSRGKFQPRYQLNVGVSRQIVLG